MEYHRPVMIDGREYVILPIEEFRRLQHSTDAQSVDAILFARKAVSNDLRSARQHAGFTQKILAILLGKSQTMIARAESGAISVGERYVQAVLKVCELPNTWKPGDKVKAIAKKAVATSAQTRRPRQILAKKAKKTKPLRKMAH